MTLPQDQRSPHRQARWLELYNAGSETIPPFAALEIVSPGSERPEQGGYTPSDGRTVLHVRKATRDNPCATVINGPCEIPVYKYGRVGTIDDPMLALVADPTYKTGTVVGLQKDSYFLQKNYCGYLIIGDYDAGTQTMRVKRWEDCPNELMVKAAECIKPGDMDKIAIVMEWNLTARCYEESASGQRVKICDCNKWLLALPGECFKVERINSCEPADGYDTCYSPSFPYGLTRRVKIEQEIGCGACGDVKIMEGRDGCNASESRCVIQACNTSSRKLGCDADEYATFHAAPGQCGGEAPDCYGWLVPNARALSAEASANSQVCGGEAVVSGVKFTDVCTWETREDVITADNPAGMYACQGDTLLLRWNDASCGWDIVAVQPHAIGKPLTDIFCDDTGACLIKGTQSKHIVYAQQCLECSETEEVELISGGTLDVITGLDVQVSGDSEDAGDSADCDTPGGVELSIVGTTKKICVLCPSEGGGTFEDGDDIPLNFEIKQVDAVTEADFTCDDACPAMSVKTTTFWAFCVGEESSADVVECSCNDCATEGSASVSPTPSGSATPSSTPSATSAGSATVSVSATPSATGV